MTAPTLQLTRTVDDYADLAWSCLLPEQGDDLWEWCSKHLTLHHGGRFDPHRARLVKHWYRVISARLSLRPDPRDPYAHRCEQLWLDLAAQIAKSTLGFSTLMGSAVNHPRIAGYYRNRKEDLNNDRDRKLLRIVERTPSLARLLPLGAAARKTALGSRSWALGNALIYFRSAGIADDLRSDAIELAVLDEFDTYAQDVEGYGDPIAQLLDRQRTLGKTRFALGITTPGIVAGHGWRRLCTGSHERPLVECPHCGGAQDLDDDQICLADGQDLRTVKVTNLWTYSKRTWAYFPMWNPDGTQNVLWRRGWSVPGSLRCISMFAPMLLLARQLGGVVEAHVTAKRAQACNPVIYYVEDPAASAKTARADASSIVGPNTRFNPLQVYYASRARSSAANTTATQRPTTQRSWRKRPSSSTADPTQHTTPHIHPWRASALIFPHSRGQEFPLARC